MKWIVALGAGIGLMTSAVVQAQDTAMTQNCYRTFGPDGGQRRGCSFSGLPDVGTTPQNEWHSKRGCNARIDALFQQCMTQANAWDQKQAANRARQNGGRTGQTQ